MNCPKCGNELKPNMKFCAKCGTPVQQPAAPVAPQQPVQQKSVAPAPSKETAQPAPATQKDGAGKPAKRKKAKKKAGKKNIALRVIAIILVIAVLATGGIFITDAILFKSESEKAGYITDFPILKQDTEFLVYDAEKFPYENYNIKVDQLSNGAIFKSSAFNKFENVINEKSDSKIFNLHLDDGKYQITLEGIVSERTQAPSTTTIAPTVPSTPTVPSNTQTTTSSAKTEEPVVITIIVIVDNDDKDAVDKVTINSKKDDEPIKEFEGVSTNSSFIEATDSDFEKLGEMLQETVGAGYYGDDKSMDSIEELLCLLHSSAGSAYRYYYGDIEYKQYTHDYVFEAKVPKENIKWICESIFNIEYKETLDYSGMNWNDSGCYFKDDYLYISEWAATGFPYSEYELDSYKLANGKYETIFDVYEEDWSGDHGAVYAGTVKVTAEIKIIDGKRYWSIYKIEEYDPNAVATPSTPKDMYDENAKLYNDYLKNGALNDLLSDDRGSMVGSGNYEFSTCMIDMNDDGIYELILRIRDSEWRSTNDCLFSIKDGKVVLLEDKVGYTGGTAGGDEFVVKYDNVQKKDVVVIEGHGRDGYWLWYSWFKTVNYNGASAQYSGLYQTRSYALGHDADVYNDEIEKIKKETSLYFFEDNGDAQRFCVCDLDNIYISQADYNNAVDGRYTDAQDSKHTMKPGTYENPLGLN